MRCTLDAGVVPMQSRKPFTIKAEPYGQCCPIYVLAVLAKVNANLAVKALRTLHAITRFPFSMAGPIQKDVVIQSKQ